MLQSCTGGDIGLFTACLDGGSDGLGGVGSDVEHFRIALQGAVVVIGSDAVGIVEVCKPTVVVCLYLQVGSNGSCLFLLRSVDNRHNLHLISTFLESWHVGPAITAIVADKLIVELTIVAVVLTFYIYMIVGCSCKGCPFHVGGLQPAACLVDCHTVGLILDERDSADITIICRVITIGGHHSDLTTVDVHLSEIRCAITVDCPSLESNIHFVLRVSNECGKEHNGYDLLLHFMIV